MINCLQTCNMFLMIFNHTDKVTPMESPSLLQTGLSGAPMDVSRKPSLCIAVIGATGELAKRKIFPALFALYYSGFLPEVQHLLLHVHLCSFNLKVLVHAFQKPQFIP